MARRVTHIDVRELAERLGVRVDRASAVTPQSTATAYFTISGGRVLITGVQGLVTVIFTATATNIKLTATPTVGTAVDMCAVVAAGSKEAGTLLGITGVPSVAMVATNAGLTTWMNTQQVLNTGTIDFSSSGNNVSSATSWSVWYLPLDAGARIVAA